MLLQPVLQGLVGQPQDRRSVGDDPVGPLHGLDDQRLFHLLEVDPVRRQFKGDHPAVYRQIADIARQVLGNLGYIQPMPSWCHRLIAFSRAVHA